MHPAELEAIEIKVEVALRQHPKNNALRDMATLIGYIQDLHKKLANLEHIIQHGPE